MVGERTVTVWRPSTGLRLLPNARLEGVRSVATTNFYSLLVLHLRYFRHQPGGQCGRIRLFTAAALFPKIQITLAKRRTVS